ncbi:Bro-N domain-containing protein, partial [Paenibacillus cisolokensis]|uniref:BRO-N domain-containing protein n=1 Tax=Paenibacillus cisolokensis TaxID=1658519 RepID=UPI003D2A1021
MNNHQVFNFNGLQVRTVDKDGQPWFVLKDVCEVLDLAHRVVRQRLSDDVCSTYAIPDALGRQQETTIINEDGLYDVILESRKPEARAFRKWVTSEVLPSIRRTGSYALQPMTTAEMIAAIANQAVEQERRLAAVEKRLDDTAEILALNPTEWRRKTTALLNKIAK